MQMLEVELPRVWSAYSGKPKEKGVMAPKQPLKVQYMAVLSPNSGQVQSDEGIFYQRPLPPALNPSGADGEALS